MPTMQDSISVAANTVTANVVAGRLYEFIESGTLVVLSCTGSAIGLRTTFIINLPVINDEAINLQNRFPLIPDDILFTGRVRRGRLFLTARNTTAGALTFFWRVDVSR